MKKKYIMPGAVERFIRFRHKNGVKVCHFANGAVNAIAVVPAIFITEDKDSQEYIENTELFKRGKIKLARVYEEQNPVVKETEQPGSYPDVTNVQSARAVLGGMGVPIELLQSKADVLQQAKERGITFPNWK